jgi:hypothetical protein
VGIRSPSPHKEVSVFKTTYDNINGHIILPFEGKRLLIDTGSPISIGSGSLDFLGREYQLHKPVQGASPEALSEFIGTKIDGLVGLDILHNHDLRLDWSTLEFDPEENEVGEILPLSFGNFGLPAIPLEVNSHTVEAIFDTGAQISYINKSVTAGECSVGEFCDFHHTVGEFTTTLYRLATKLGEQLLTLDYGLLPASVYGGNLDILGTEVLKHFPVTLRFSRREFVVG